MSPAQRLLSANYLFEMMVGLLGLQEAIDSEVKIYVYEANEMSVLIPSIEDP